jgi:DNA gyrase subunit A
MRVRLGQWEEGYGKRTDIDDYRVTNRGGKGVKTINVTEKTGALVAIKNVTDADDLMIINKSGIVIRIVVSELRVMGRATQGVRLITLKGNDEIASVAKIEHEDEEIDVEDENSSTDDEGSNIVTTEASAEETPKDADSATEDNNPDTDEETEEN